MNVMQSLLQTLAELGLLIVWLLGMLANEILYRAFAKVQTEFTSLTWIERAKCFTYIRWIFPM